MSINPAGDLNDAEAFNVDSWIDDVVRPETTVLLYPFEADFAKRVAAIEAQIPAAEKATDRGMDDPTPEVLFAQIQELRTERDAKAKRARVRQLTSAEIAAVAKSAVEAGVTEPRIVDLWVVAAACLEPIFTPEQLERLRKRDRSGESMVAQLVATVNGLMAGPPVPSSPER